MARIFMSYNRESETMARSLVEDLESMGHTAWFDQDLSGGQAWWHQILATIRESDVFLFVMDPHSLNSNACKKELNYAADLGKPVLPVLVADGVSMALLPPELTEIQFIDYRKQDRATALSLAKALNSLPAPKPLPDPLPPLPDVPVSYLGGLTRKIDSSASLSYEEQSGLVIDLKRSMKEPGAAEDARTLLKKLRSRRDLYASVAEDIDELLREPVKGTPSISTQTLHEPEIEPDSKPGQEVRITPRTDTPVNNIRAGNTASSDRMVIHGLIIGATVGAILQIFLSIVYEYFNIVSFIFPIILGGSIGAFIGFIRYRIKRKSKLLP